MEQYHSQTKPTRNVANKMVQPSELGKKHNQWTISERNKDEKTRGMWISPSGQPKAFIKTMTQVKKLNCWGKSYF